MDETYIEQGDAKIVVAVNAMTSITVSIIDSRTGLEREDVRLPYPSRGYGGHEVVVSAQESYVALFLYSGQSEVGYELFAIRGGLRHLGGLGYVQGEGERPVFSSDECWLAMAWDRYVEWETLDHTRQCFVEWGELAVQQLPDGDIQRTLIHARVPAGWDPGDMWTAPRRLRFASPHELRLCTPWGTEPAIRFPLPQDKPVRVS